MPLNEEILEEFKKSLASTIKSIGKSETIEVNFVKDQSSIDGDIINLLEPDINTINKNLNYIRAEADSMALEVRFHEKKIHEKYITNNDITNQIFSAVEQSRVEAKGSEIFKGIKSNILNKHQSDLLNSRSKIQDNKDIINAFRYVSYSELTDTNLKGDFKNYKKIIKNKLGNKYEDFFLKLKHNISNQKKFAEQLQLILDDLGFYNDNSNNEENNSIDNEDENKNSDNPNQDNKHDDKSQKI